MGFNRRYLPEIDEMIKIRERFQSDQDFVKYIVGKSDAIFGSSESMRFLEELSGKTKQKNQNNLDGSSTPGAVS